MTIQSRRWGSRYLAARLIISLATCALCAQTMADMIELSNEKILSSIPSMFDNIGIIRYSELDTNTVVGREFLRTFPPGAILAGADHSMRQYLQEHLSQEGLSVNVTALSSSEVGSSSDSSERNVLQIYVANEPTREIEAVLAARVHVQRIEHPDFSLYQEINARQLEYAAFFGDNTVLLANDAESIEFVVERLLAQAPEPEATWSELSEVNRSAPILILRNLKYPIPQPEAYDTPNEGNFAIGMWISDASRAAFELEIASDLDLEEAKNYLRVVGAIEALSGPEGVALEIRPSGENYMGDLQLLYSEMGDHHTDLAFHWLLGIWFAI